MNAGTLYIIATPIGNLEDISPRAIQTLKKVDCIAAEDTRHSLPLLKQFGIENTLLSLHDYNEHERALELLKKLEQGQSIALISDAGTPLISDPGFFLVREARKQGVKIVPIPGACAAIAALSVSGLATDKFVFEGFLPAKSKMRRDRLTCLKDENRTLILYESPRRIIECLEDIRQVFGESRKAVLARELTKVFETIHEGSMAELIAWIKQDENQERGEMVLLIEGAAEKSVENEVSFEPILAILLSELPLKQAVDLTVKITGNKKNLIYEKALVLKNK